MPGGTEANAKAGARGESRGLSETRGLEADPGAAGSRVMVVLFALAVSVLASAAIPLSLPPASDSHSLSASDLHPSGTLGYSTYLGGVMRDFDWGAAVGAFGSAYVVGTTMSADFPTTPGAFDRTLAGADGFVAKFSPDGSRLDWATFLGGSSTDWASAVAVDASGNVYVAGLTYSTDFPVTAGAFDTTINGAVDVFVAELSADGSRVLWATFLGSTENENARAIAIDTSGDVFVTGWTDSPGFPVTPGAFDRTCGTDGNCNPNGMLTQNDVFVAKIRWGGASLVWSTFLGGEGGDEPVSLALDAAGSPVVAGRTVSAEFPTTAGAYQPTRGAFADAFVTELTANGTALDWSTYFGGNGDEGATAAIDPAGAIVVSGVTNSTDLPTSSGVVQPSIAGQWDGFVGKLSSNASRVLWLTYIGGSGDDGAEAVVGSTGTIFVGGSTESADFPVTGDAFDPSYNGGGPDWFLTELSPTGGRIAYSTFLGGTNYDEFQGITLDTTGHVYLHGRTESADFPTTPGAFDPIYNNGGDVAVIGPGPPPPNRPPTLSWTGEPGYGNDGLDPETGTTRTTFSYRVVYSDADGDPSASIEVALEKPVGTPYQTSAMLLTGWRGQPGNYTQGAIYALTTTLASGMDWSYSFRASDGWDAASGPPTSPVDAPDVVADGPPVAVARASPTVAHLGDGITFDGTGSTDDFGIVAYRWDFGDGATNDTAVATHVYGTRGSFLSTLTVWDTANQSGTDEVSVAIENRPPIANAGPDLISRKRTLVTLDGTGSSDPDGDALMFSWTQVGGPPVILVGGSGARPSFTPPLVAAYTFRMSVDDDQGGMSADMVQVATWGLPPGARLVANRTTSPTGEDVRFDGGDSFDPDGTIADFALAFGDGVAVNGTQASRTHAFGTPGSYTVTLMVTDEDGNTSEAQVTVEITPPPVTPPPVPASTNWKPLVAAVFACVLALTGAWSSRRRPWKGRSGSKRVAAAFCIASLPFVLAEAATGLVSFATGLLSIPPVIGLGTAVDVGILVGGVAVAVGRLRVVPSKRGRAPASVR